MLITPIPQIPVRMVTPSLMRTHIPARMVGGRAERAQGSGRGKSGKKKNPDMLVLQVFDGREQLIAGLYSSTMMAKCITLVPSAMNWKPQGLGIVQP